MRIRNDNVMAILAVTGILIISPSTYARLGDDPGIGELITRADMICCGRIVGYKTNDVVGDPRIWVAARFVVDHKIKGSCPTNEILILMGNLKDQKTPDNFQLLVDQLNREWTNTPPRRCLVFLNQKDVKKYQFELVDEMNGMIQVGPIPPFEEKDVTTEARIATELKRGLEQLDIAQQAQIKAVLRNWKRDNQGATNK